MGSPDWVAGYQALSGISQQVRVPLTEHPGGEAALWVMPVRPARLPRLARKLRSVNPDFLSNPGRYSCSSATVSVS